MHSLWRLSVDHVGRPTFQLIQRFFDHSDLILLLLINHTLFEHLERFADRTGLGVSLHYWTKPSSTSRIANRGAASANRCELAQGLI